MVAWNLLECKFKSSDRLFALVSNNLPLDYGMLLWVERIQFTFFHPENGPKKLKSNLLRTYTGMYDSFYWEGFQFQTTYKEISL